MSDLDYKKRNDTYKGLLFSVIFIVLIIIFGYANKILFFRQAHCYEYMEGERIKYFSDMPFYIEGLDVEKEHSYPLLFDFSRVLMKFLEANDAMAMAVLILNMLCVPVLTVFFWNSIKESKNLLYRIGALGLPYVIMLVSMVWLPSGNEVYGIERRYLGVFTPNPWHNQTYLAARPFAIIAFVLFVKIICYYEEKIDIKDYVLFSVALLVATIAKPSFTLVLGSAALPFMIVRFVVSKFSTLKNSILLGICFLPTIIDLYMQFFGMFGAESTDEGGGIAYGFLDTWYLFSENIPLSLALALAFPIIVLLFNLRAFVDNRSYRFAWEFLLAGTLEFMFLKENGERFQHANFAWGYMYGLFFIFLMSTWLLVKNTVDKKNHVIVLCIEWLGLMVHLAAGIIYFVYLLKGGNYMRF